MFKFLAIEGMGNFDKAVLKLEAEVIEARKEGLKAAGKILKDAWQENIASTLTHGYATGAYHDSIEVSDMVSVETAIGEIPGVEVGTTIEPRAGETYAYPFYLEFGTVDIPEGYPTMIPAFEDNKDEAIAACEAVFLSIIEAFPTMGAFAPGVMAQFMTSLSVLESNRTGNVWVK